MYTAYKTSVLRSSGAERPHNLVYDRDSAKVFSSTVVIRWIVSLARRGGRQGVQIPEVVGVALLLPDVLRPPTHLSCSDVRACRMEARRDVTVDHCESLPCPSCHFRCSLRVMLSRRALVPTLVLFCTCRILNGVTYGTDISETPDI
jgi:hypothetical protein